MKKFLLRFLLFNIIVLIVFGIFTISYVNSIRFEVTESDLPQDVYESDGNLLMLAKLKIVGLVIAGEDERYTMIEEIINLIILDTIQENINTSYNPVGDCQSDACQYIYKESPSFINYVYSYLNESNQIVVIVSGGIDKFFSVDTALQMVFDVDIDIFNMTVDFTLASYQLGNKELSIKTLDFIVSRIDKESVESSVTFGELDLDTYKYTLSISDAF